MRLSYAYKNNRYSGKSFGKGLRNMNKLLLVALCFAGLAVCLFAVGCASNAPYRTDFNPVDPSLPGPDPTNAVIEAEPGAYSLGFVEFDDQGWFMQTKEKSEAQDRAKEVLQKNAVEAMIKRETGMDGSSKPCGAIIVLFVHGWKNNAAYDNTNVGTFRSVLKQLSDVEKEASKKQNRDPRKLIGVYAGWRGLAETLEPFKELSFWGRKNAAQRVGSYGAMTELMVDLEMLQKANNTLLPPGTPPTKLIIVGHSFGADVVYNAISQIIAERFINTIKGRPGEVLKPLGDQVILLNPAFEAARMYDLKQLALSAKGLYSTNQRPVLTVFQSEGDGDTRGFFPIGQTLGTLWQLHRTDFQKQANHETVGWFDPFVTHELQYNPTEAASSSGDHGDVPGIPHTLREPRELPAVTENIAIQREIWRSGTSDTNVFGNCVLKSVNGYIPHNPILVVRVNKQIMKDHNDISNPVLINFLQEYIPFCDDDSDPAAGEAK
jgi:hypothetical protein